MKRKKSLIKEETEVLIKTNTLKIIDD